MIWMNSTVVCEEVNRYHPSGKFLDLLIDPHSSLLVGFYASSVCTFLFSVRTKHCWCKYSLYNEANFFLPSGLDIINQHSTGLNRG